MRRRPRWASCRYHKATRCPILSFLCCSTFRDMARDVRVTALEITIDALVFGWYLLEGVRGHLSVHLLGDAELMKKTRGKGARGPRLTWDTWDGGSQRNFCHCMCGLFRFMRARPINAHLYMITITTYLLLQTSLKPHGILTCE